MGYSTHPTGMPHSMTSATSSWDLQCKLKEESAASHHAVGHVRTRAACYGTDHHQASTTRGRAGGVIVGNQALVKNAHSLQKSTAAITRCIHNDVAAL